MYTDWKGNKQIAYIMADSLQEAKETAQVLQGLSSIESVTKEE